MKLAIHSDLHLEGQRLDLNFCSDTNFDVLVLAGDIVNARNLDRLGVIRDIVKDKPILYVPGNHEYYGGHINETKEQLVQVCESHNITLLDQDVVTIAGVNFIGCTGWSTMDLLPDISAQEGKEAISTYINDFRVIEGNNFEAMIERGKADHNFIETSLQSLTGTNVVITHFSPALQYRNQRFGVDVFASYFSNPWEHLMITHEPAMWIYGHTHYNHNDVTYKTRVVTNQRGYRNECLDYNPNMVIEV